MQPEMKPDHVLNFFTRVLPRTGNYFAGSQKAGAGHLHQDGPIKDLIVLAAKCTKRHGETRDVWYATGSYGNTRSSRDARLKRCFYADFDCGPDKPYPNVKAAMGEFFAKIRKHRLPRPTLIVMSGNGFHPYWTLNDDVPVSAWLPVATKLEETLKQAGLFIDHVTKDASRLLRVPGSLNYKDPSNPKQCFIYEPATLDFDYGLEDLRVALNVLELETDPNLPSNPTPVDNSDLSTGTVTALAPEPAKRMFTECPMFTNVLNSRGAGVSEPLWQNQLLALTFTADGETYAHQISEGHSGYSPQNTDKKYQDKQKQALNLNGPPRCSTFKEAGATECPTCPHWGRIANPVLLCREPEVTLPPGYAQSNNGVFKLGEDEDDANTLVFPHKIVGVQLISDLDNTDGALKLDIQLSADFIKTVDIPTEYLGDGRRLSQELGRRTIALKPSQKTGACTFMTSWVQELAKNKQHIAPVNQFGWRESGGLVGFTVGGEIFWSDKTRSSAPVRVDAHIGRHYQPKGSLAPWKHAADRITRQGYPEYQVALASAFAAPLMRLTGISGVLLSLMSPNSGTGKSTILKLAQSVWGDPIQGINALNDTANAVAHKMGIINNLPAYWDELRAHADVKQFLKVVFTVTQGKEKSRMSGAQGFTNTGSWDTLVVSASNESMLGHVDESIHGSDAGRYRIFEIRLDRKGGADAVANQAFNNVRDNYGHAGRRYGKVLAERKQAVRDLVVAEQERLNKHFGAKQEERFWTALIACLMAGARIAKGIGLVDFDIGGMRGYLNHEFHKHRGDLGEATKNTSQLEILKHYLASTAASVVTTDYLSGRDNPKPSLAQAHVPIPPYSAQHANVEKKYIIPISMLKDWTRRNNIGNFQGVIQGLEEKGARIGTRHIIGHKVAGLIPSTRVRCIELDLTHPEFHDFSDDYPDD